MYSNPLPPMKVEEEDEEHPLTNEDFRKLMMTPMAKRSSSRTSSSSAMHPPVPPGRHQSLMSELDDHEIGDHDDDPAARRRKKKSYYAKLKKMEEDRQKELDAKYRDRARERREGDGDQTADIVSTTADYRAVAPDAKAGENYAERRKQLIQESKYLGGDMEHTHLVKGLDYALLDKVRAEITSKEREEDDMDEIVIEKKPEKESEEVEENIEFRTKMGRNIFRTIFKSKYPERNDLFLPGRMAYVVDLEDDFAESDIPCTMIRSKADCPSLDSTTTLTANDIVINKLTQILSYLRQGRRERKKLKNREKGRLKDEEKPREKLVGADESIYKDLDDFISPNSGKIKEKDRKDRDRRDRDRERDNHRDQNRDRDRHRDRYEKNYRGHDRDRHDRDRGRDRHGDRDNREKRKSYFEKPAEEDEDRLPDSAKDLVRSINEKFATEKYDKTWAQTDISQEAGFRLPEGKKQGEERVSKIKKKMEVDSYAECYPGMMESADAIDDSDDEADYTKMDQGNKKGPIGRWDFDTQEEYSDYMSNKEALPKAAFQYGVKMADGRKTRRTAPRDEKAVLDREWQKIQNIIAKRKHMGTHGEPHPKVSKY